LITKKKQVLHSKESLRNMILRNLM